MKAKWYIFVFVFALLFAANQQQVSSPNQEVVLQFNGGEVTSVATQKAIAIVKEQLQSIGVTNIQVLEKEDGTLKITYYSNTDAARIKELLSENKALRLGAISCNNSEKHSKPASKKNTTFYNLDVFEIQKQDSGFGLGGKYAVELKSEKNQFLNPFIPTDEAAVKEIGCNIEKEYNFRNYVPTLIKNTSLRIPDGRAGPNC